MDLSWTRYVTLAITLLLYMSQGMNSSEMGPFFPVEAAAKGVSQTMIGVIFSSGAIANIIASVVLMSYSKPETQKLTFCIGGFASAISYFAFGYVNHIPSTTLFTVTSIIARSITGFGVAMLWSTGLPILLTKFPDSPGKIASISEAFYALGLMVGPPVGSFLYSLGGYTLPFAVPGTLQFIMVLMCCFLLPNAAKIDLAATQTLHPAELSGRSLSISQIDRGTLAFITSPGIILVTLPLLILVSSQSYLSVTLAIYLFETYNVGGDTAGLYFLVFAGLGAMVAPGFGTIVDKGFGGPIFATSIVTTAIGYFLVFLPQLIPSLICRPFLLSALGLIGISYSGGLTSVYLLFEKTGARYGFTDKAKIKLIVASWLNCCFGFGAITGQIFIGGMVFQAFGFYVSSLLQGVAAALFGVAGILFLLRAGLLKRVYYNEPQDPLLPDDK